jgi:hypothetical protein
MGDAAVRGPDSPKRIRHNRHCARLVATESPQVTNGAARALQSHPRCIDGNSENGRDLSQAVSLNIFQEKHISMKSRQLKGSQYRALKGPWPLQS